MSTWGAFIEGHLRLSLFYVDNFPYIGGIMRWDEKGLINLVLKELRSSWILYLKLLIAFIEGIWRKNLCRKLSLFDVHNFPYIWCTLHSEMRWKVFDKLSFKKMRSSWIKFHAHHLTQLCHLGIVDHQTQLIVKKLKVQKTKAGQSGDNQSKIHFRFRFSTTPHRTNNVAFLE